MLQHHTEKSLPSDGDPRVDTGFRKRSCLIKKSTRLPQSEAPQCMIFTHALSVRKALAAARIRDVARAMR